MKTITHEVVAKSLDGAIQLALRCGYTRAESVKYSAGLWVICFNESNTTN
jgi:hypothetical protein